MRQVLRIIEDQVKLRLEACVHKTSNFACQGEHPRWAFKIWEALGGPYASDLKAS